MTPEPTAPGPERTTGDPVDPAACSRTTPDAPAAAVADPTAGADPTAVAPAADEAAIPGVPGVGDVTAGDGLAGDGGTTGDGAGDGHSGGVRQALPSWRALLAWAVFAAVVTALDGWVGAATAVVVAAVVLAGLRIRVLGALGSLALAAVPVAVVLGGVPGPDSVTPNVVTRSLLPHHLTFAGLVLVLAYVVLDLAPHLVLGRPPDDEVGAGAAAVEVAPPGAGLSPQLRVAVVAVVAVATAAAVVAVVAR